MMRRETRGSEEGWGNAARMRAGLQRGAKGAREQMEESHNKGNIVGGDQNRAKDPEGARANTAPTGGEDG